MKIFARTQNPLSVKTGPLWLSEESRDEQHSTEWRFEWCSCIPPDGKLVAKCKT